MSTVQATPSLPSISLYYKDEKSNKEYHLSVLGDDNKGYQVQYRFGRRGSKLQCKFKNQVPLHFEQAMVIFGNELQQKLKEGYTKEETGTPYSGTENQGKLASVKPMLMNEITEAGALELIENDDWLMQEKKNGVRQMIQKNKESIEGVNKKGFIVAIPATTANAIKLACGQANAILDGELVGETYWLFDILSIGVHAFTNKPYVERVKEILEWIEFATGFEEQDNYFKVIPTAVGKASKKALFKKLKEENAEGVVFKKKSSTYKAGRPASGGDVLKFKFYATATVRCKCLNDKSSFQMEMLSKGDWVPVGNCTFAPQCLLQNQVNITKFVTCTPM